MNSHSLESTGADNEAKKQLVSEILGRLDRKWMPSEWVPSRRPVDELVATILSQNTSDTNTERAFKSLREQFPTWKALVDAPVSGIEEAIRAGGLASQKAPRIQRALREIIDPSSSDPNQELFERLDNMDSDEGMDWLTSMDGVGPKTAACVLLFAVGKPVVPVDTHVFRVSMRIGLIAPRSNAERAHIELLGLVQPQESYRFHMHLIHHGRAICKARSPRCLECVLLDVCHYGTEFASRSRSVSESTRGSRGNH